MLRSAGEVLLCRRASPKMPETVDHCKRRGLEDSSPRRSWRGVRPHRPSPGVALCVCILCLAALMAMRGEQPGHGGAAIARLASRSLAEHLAGGCCPTQPQLGQFAFRGLKSHFPACTISRCDVVSRGWCAARASETRDGKAAARRSGRCPSPVAVATAAATASRTAEARHRPSRSVALPQDAAHQPGFPNFSRTLRHGRAAGLIRHLCAAADTAARPALSLPGAWKAPLAGMGITRPTGPPWGRVRDAFGR